MGSESGVRNVESYTTIAESVDTELEISRSRFLTRLERVGTEDSAREVIARVRAEHPKARHHCTAFVLGPHQRVQRSNDDGEPSGTAGSPMLETLRAEELSDVVAVVTRYFGGILLGAAGLTRAYRSATAQAVAVARRIRRHWRIPLSLTLSYDLLAPFEHEIRKRGYLLGDAVYAQEVEHEVLVPETEIETCTQLIAELTSGVSVPRTGEGRYVDAPLSNH